MSFTYRSLTYKPIIVKLTEYYEGITLVPGEYYFTFRRLYVNYTYD